jgi:type 1 glutamine amidotransferase
MRTSQLIRRLTGLAVVAGAAVMSFSAQGADKRFVLIAGRPSHPPGMHEFRAGSMLLQKALTGFPGVKVDVYTMGWPSREVDGQRVDDNTPLETADAIFIYADGGRNHPAIQGDRPKLLDALAAKGVGLGFGHYGVEVPAGAPGETMQRWIGGYYETNWSVNPMWSPNFTKFPNHPVTRGVGPFSNRDEWYFNMRWTPDQQLKRRMLPLLLATPSDEVRKGPYVSPRGPYDHIVAASGQEETMMWVMERPDGGRGFGFTGGHTHTNWGDPNQRKIVLNALLWAAKVNVPARGVEDKITADDLTQNLDDKTKK